MLKTLLLSIVTLSLAGAPATEHDWAWIQTVPNGTTWVTRAGRADVALEGGRFEATLYDQDGAQFVVLRGQADGDALSGVDPYSPTSGTSEHGLAPSWSGQHREAFPQTVAVEGAPPAAAKRMWESITLTRADSFIGFTRQ